jgi:hypothetical protein
MNEAPWPCKISRFLGYDEDEVQIYQVDFLASRDIANLESFNLLPITQEKLERMKKQRDGRYAKNPAYLLALRLAAQKIKQAKENADKDPRKRPRFLSLYCSDSRQVTNFVDIDEHTAIANPDKHDKQDKLSRILGKQLKLNIDSIFSVSCVVSTTVSGQLMAVISEKSKIFTTISSKGPSPSAQTKQGQITIEIWDWPGPSSAS